MNIKRDEPRPMNMSDVEYAKYKVSMLTKWIDQFESDLERENCNMISAMQQQNAAQAAVCALESLLSDLKEQLALWGDEADPNSNTKEIVNTNSESPLPMSPWLRGEKRNNKLEDGA